MSTNKEELLKKVNDTIAAVENGDSKYYFFVADSKNNPNAPMMYIYDLALEMSKQGKDVTMLYQTEDEYVPGEIDKLMKEGQRIDENRVFTGVGRWLGEEYAKLRHQNLSSEELKTKPSDFIFVPEAFSSFMKQLRKYHVPCKVIAVLTNFDYVTDFIPLGDEWINYGVRDVVTLSNVDASLIRSVFPYEKTFVLKPYVPSYFRKPVAPSNLIVNMVCKSPRDVEKIVKQFYWRYPAFKFVSFRDLRNLPRTTFAEKLQDGCITVWVDDETSFGFSAIEALKCGNIVIGKVPSRPQDWMVKDDNTLVGGIQWFDDKDNVSELIANNIALWMEDNDFEEIREAASAMDGMFSYEEFSKGVSEYSEYLVKEKLEELKAFAQNVEKIEGENEKKEEE